MDDLISRQAIIKSIMECAEAAHSNHEWDMEQGYLNAIECIKEEPSAEPEQKRGKWIESTELSEQVKGKKLCSNCGKAQYAIELTDKTIQIKSSTSKFCPECGARMEGGKEDE